MSILRIPPSASLFVPMTSNMAMLGFLVSALGLLPCPMLAGVKAFEIEDLRFHMGVGWVEVELPWPLRVSQVVSSELLPSPKGIFSLSSTSSI